MSKHVHLEQAAQDLIQAGFEYFQRRKLHNPSGLPVLVLCHPQREEVLPHVQTELPMLQFVPVASCPALRYLKAIIRPPRSLLFCRLNKPSSLSLS